MEKETKKERSDEDTVKQTEKRERQSWYTEKEEIASLFLTERLFAPKQCL